MRCLVIAVLHNLSIYALILHFIFILIDILKIPAIESASSFHMPRSNAVLRGSKLSNRAPRKNGLVLALAASLLALAGSSASAASVGDLRTIAPVAGNDATASAWEITTVSGSR